MSAPECQPRIAIWTTAAFATLSWALTGLAYAQLAPSENVPRIFQNFHVEHFAAFYVVALLTAAALPRTRLLKIGLCLVFLAAAFSFARLTALVHKFFDPEDFLCDIAGVSAALAPIFASRLCSMDRTTLD